LDPAASEVWHRAENSKSFRSSLKKNRGSNGFRSPPELLREKLNEFQGRQGGYIAKPKQL
jgi:hypothetical protein